MCFLIVSGLRSDGEFISCTRIQITWFNALPTEAFCDGTVFKTVKYLSTNHGIGYDDCDDGSVNR
jgi:hypothetical protein